ncbi:MAG: PEP-CTERM sorting domain-containing protein [Tepidisphaerales bacterium]
MNRRTPHARRVIGRCCLAAALACAAPIRASAISINISYDNPQNDPAYDPDGSKMTAVVQACAQMWEQLQPDSQTFSITVHYNTVGGTQLAFFNPIDNTITVGSNVNWFIDANPYNTTDFAPLTQTLYGDLTAAQKLAAFTGTAPSPLLEVGYHAQATSNAAKNGYDMFSVLLHEMGHMTGISTNLLSPDVDLPSQFVGDVGGIKAKRADNAHIAGPDALMQPAIPQGVRRLPSALDVIVNAHEKGFSTINLARIDYFGGTIFNPANLWNIGNGWEGGQAPTSQTDAFVRWGGTMTLISPGNAQNLTVVSASQLVVLDSLNVGNSLTLGLASDSQPSVITVNAPGNLSVGNAINIGNGQLVLNGTTATAGGPLNIGANGLVQGSGVVHAQSVINEGHLVGDGGLLRVQSDTTINLDGTGKLGAVYATTGDVSLESNIAGAFPGSFQGVMQIASGHQVSYVGPLVLLGNLNFVGVPGGPATLTGGAGSSFSTNSGGISVAGGVSAIIDVPQINLNFGGANNLVGTVYKDGVLTLAGPTSLANSGPGELSGDGTLRLNAPVTVNGPFNLTVHSLDWDGYQVATPTVTTVNSGGTLTIVADTVDPTGVYNGLLQMHNGGLASVTQTSGLGTWTVGTNGTILFLDGGKVTGSPLVMRGSIEVATVGGTFGSHVFLNSTSQVVVHDNTTLDFLDQVNYSGGQVTTDTGQINFSMIRQFGPSNVSGLQTITTGYFNWDPSSSTDSSTTIQPNSVLEIHALRIGSAPILQFHTAGFGDTIHLNSGQLGVLLQDPPNARGLADAYWELNATGVLELNHVGQQMPTVYGSPLVSHGLIRGEGQFLNPLSSDGVIAPGGLGGVGLITLQNLFTELGTGKLDFDLGGYTPGTAFDQLLNNAQGTLDGELDVHLLGGFEPVVGDRFRIIDGQPGSSLTGTFATTSLPALAGAAWNVDYGANFVELQVVPVPEPATWGLMVLGAAGAALLRRRRRSTGRSGDWRRKC